MTIIDLSGWSTLWPLLVPVWAATALLVVRAFCGAGGWYRLVLSHVDPGRQEPTRRGRWLLIGRYWLAALSMIIVATVVTVQIHDHETLSQQELTEAAEQLKGEPPRESWIDSVALEAELERQVGTQLEVRSLAVGTTTPDPGTEERERFEATLQPQQIDPRIDADQEDRPDPSSPVVCITVSHWAPSSLPQQQTRRSYVDAVSEGRCQ